MNDDLSILRDLAAQYAELAKDPEMDRRRDLWRRHNSLQRTPVPVFVRAFAWKEMPQRECRCQDPFLRQFEGTFRNQIFRSTFGDDSIFEPWVTLAATKTCHGWGVPIERRHSGVAGGANKVNYPIKELADVAKLRVPWHEIDEEQTARNHERLQEAIGDLLTIDLDRGPAYWVWSADLSTDIHYLRGIEHFMMDMVDEPEWLHRLMKFLSDGVRKTHDEAEAAGDWGLSRTQNQSMPYALELPDPAPNVRGVPRKQLWCHLSAQEFTGVGPAMHDEFLLQYQLPIAEPFGLLAYGCCEDLTHKIDMLRQVPNLRRIAVSPFADAARCAEQIGTDYVYSYRPSPADMVGYGFDPDRIRRILRRDLTAAKDCIVDITLKDVETVQGDTERCRHWVEVTRDVLAELGLA